MDIINRPSAKARQHAIRGGQKPPTLKLTAKPTRRQLVKIIAELQTRIGRAKGAYLNDRDANRARNVLEPLEEAFNMCVESLQFDPPQ